MGESSRRMKVRISYGIDKLLEGDTYYEKWIIDDLRALARPATPEPTHGIPATDVKGVDTEYDKEGELLTLGFANTSITAGIEWATPGSKAISSRALRETAWLVGHNIPGDIDQLLKNNLPVKEEWLQGRKIIDTFVLAKLEDENKPRGSYGLEQLMLTNYNVQPWKAETDKKFAETEDARDWTPEEREARCSKDAWATFMLAKKLYPKIAHDRQTKILVETLHRISMTLYRIGLAGAKVDTIYLSEFATKNAMQVAELEERLRVEVLKHSWDKDEPFCPTKDDDIRHLLFDLLWLQPIHKTANGLPAVDKTSLKQYEKNYPQLITPLLEFNKAQKLDSGYRDTASYLDEHGFLHMWINQLGARTGRRSSGGGIEGTPSSKNWQNATPAAKGMIVSRFPGGKIGAFDYQSLEPVLAAWVAQDGKLFDFFYNGRGYLDVAKDALGLDIDKKSPQYRAVKSMTLGIFYNMQARLMAKNLWLGVGMAEPYRFSADYDEHVEITGEHRQKIVGSFKGLQRYWERQKLALAQDGYITAPDGFIRHLPHHGEKTPKYWKLVNQAINFPIQHLASMVTGCAMVDCEQAMLKRARWTYSDWQHWLKTPGEVYLPTLINEVHDELTWDIPEGCEEETELILTTMASPPSLRKLIPDFDISLKIEAKITDRWGA